MRFVWCFEAVLKSHFSLLTSHISSVKVGLDIGCIEWIVKRPLIIFAVSLVAGIICGNAVDSYSFAAASIAVIVTIFSVVYIRTRRFVFLLSGVLLFYSVGSIGLLYRKTEIFECFRAFDGYEVEIGGTVKSYPDVKASGVSYIVDVKTIKKEGKTYKTKGKVLLSVYGNDAAGILDYGRKITAGGELALPKGRRNPGGFDYRLYLAGNGVSATVFTSPSEVKAHAELGSNPLEGFGLGIRNRIISTINSTMPPQQAGLLNGMLIGYREGLDQDVQSAFSNAGLTHIMAVSGANVAFIILPLLFIFKRMGLRTRSSSFIIIGVLVLFVYITGFEPSVLRAVIMAVIVLTGKIIMRESDVLTCIALAAIVMLVHNPLVLLNIGFQLSFTATLSLVLFYKEIKEKLRFRLMPELVADVLAATLAAQIGVLPISVYHFNQISLISVLSNLLVVPLTQVVTILGFLIALVGQVSLPLAQLAGYVNCSLLSFILFVTKITAELPFAVIKVATPSILFVALYYVAVLFLLWYKPLYKPAVKIEQYIYTSVAVLVVWALPMIFPRGMEVVFLDVGQGDSTFIRTAAGKTVLVDGGGFSSRKNQDSTMGDTVVVPFLLDYGVTRLDIVVATHGHDDHIQGLLPVIRNIAVSNIIVAENPGYESEFRALLNEAKKRNITVSTCKKGERILIDKNTIFEVLHPKVGYIPGKSPLNNGSIVLKLDYKDTEVLLTGDIEEEAERTLVESGADLKSDFLKVAHHGSNTSSTSQFLEAVGAKAGAISVGRNSFGHPSPEVLERLEEHSMDVFRTDRYGGIVLKSNGKNIKIIKTVMVEK